MAQILIGLTNNKTSFWDPNTRTYLTLSNKTKTVTFNDADPEIGKHLERICHGLFASNTAIKLYEGKIPEEAINYWKAKFNLPGLNIAKNRADKLNAASAVKEAVVTQSATKAKVVELSTEPVEEAVTEAVETPVGVETKKTKTTRNKTTDK